VCQTWRSRSDVPETFRAWISSWLRHNDDWQYWLWTDVDIRLLVATVFPHYLTMFDSYPAQGYRVDAFRRDLYSSACTLYVDLIIKFTVEHRVINDAFALQLNCKIEKHRQDCSAKWL